MSSNCGMEVAGIIAMLLIGGLVGILIGSGYVYQTDVTKLGNAICIETTGTPFVSYANGVVKCANVDQIRYDGIKIEVNR